jgi:hypothetical protein
LLDLLPPSVGLRHPGLLNRGVREVLNAVPDILRQHSPFISRQRQNLPAQVPHGRGHLFDSMQQWRRM